jgi:hypothetical protein
MLISWSPPVARTYNSKVWRGPKYLCAIGVKGAFKRFYTKVVSKYAKNFPCLHLC